jgi:hypothetical protein
MAGKVGANHSGMGGADAVAEGTEPTRLHVHVFRAHLGAHRRELAREGEVVEIDGLQEQHSGIGLDHDDPCAITQSKLEEPR